MQGLPDKPGANGIMGNPGGRDAFRHLFPIDTASIRTLAGTTLRNPATAWSTDGASWSSVVQITTSTSSSPPSLDGNLLTSTPLRAAYWNPLFDFAAVTAGTHASWTSEPAASTAGDVDQAVSVASSTFDETMVAWLNNCTVWGGCDVSWAWTNNHGSSWSRGIITAVNTFERATVDYDPSGDRFVLAYIDRTAAKVMTRSAQAYAAPAWTAEHATAAVPYRHLGGMAFDYSGNGLLVASANVAGINGYIAQFDVVRSGGDYSLTNAHWLTSPANLADTRRPFGIAYDTSSGRVMVAWRDVGAPRPLAIATKTGGLSASNSFGNPSFPVTAIIAGTDLAFDRTNLRFVAGFTAP